MAWRCSAPCSGQVGLTVSLSTGSFPDLVPRTVRSSNTSENGRPHSCVPGISRVDASKPGSWHLRAYRPSENKNYFVSRISGKVPYRPFSPECELMPSDGLPIDQPSSHIKRSFTYKKPSAIGIWLVP